jgi:deoxycytidine triphosphate deaminase
MTEFFRGILGGEEFYPNPAQLARRLDESPYREDIINYIGGKNQLKRLLRWPKQGRGELTDVGILRHFLAGNIRIEPFNIRRLQTNGYDVSLGEYYYKCIDVDNNGSGARYPVTKTRNGMASVFNPADEQNVSDFYQGPNMAISVSELVRRWYESNRGVGRSEWLDRTRFFEGLEGEDRIIIADPGEMILGHTEEFIGGRNVVDTNISGKSTVGRAGIEVCSDASKGDVGFTGRWTLEIRNKHVASATVLLVGDPYATITFMEVESPVVPYEGRYSIQSGDWKPEMMLPRWKRKK